jgi:alkylated DNA repair dioxygenase AlkB
MDYYHKYKKYLKKYERLKNLTGGADYSKVLNYNIYAIELPRVIWFPKNVTEQIKIDSYKYKDADEKTKLKSLLWIYNNKSNVESNYQISEFKINTYYTPRGFSIYKINSINFNDVKKELINLYKEGPKRNILIQSTAKGFDSVKLNDDKEEFNSKYRGYLYKSLDYLRKKNFNDLANYIEQYAKISSEIINYDYQKYIEESDIQISHYTSKIGIRWHFDNITRDRENEIISIHIGNGDIYYDMAPVYTKAYDKPVRIQIANGCMCVMSGDSRYKWTHGIPNNIPGFKGKFSILFKR